MQSRSRPVTSWLTGVELLSALSRKVRERMLDRGDATRIAALYEEHLDAGYYSLLALDVADLGRASDWIRRFDNALRTLDALHLAVVARESLSLATADQRLAELAQEAGVKVVRVG